MLLTKNDSKRGKHPIGVYFHEKTGRFVAQINKYSKRQNLGYFKTEIEAFNAYKSAKEQYLRDLAEKWKSQIDPRAYQALLNYRVEITD